MAIAFHEAGEKNGDKHRREMKALHASKHAEGMAAHRRLTGKR